MAKTFASPSYRPLYGQIKALLTQALIAGEWRPGEMIPSEIDLAGRYQVSQGTVRKAIDALAAENILLRRQGKGTFVATHDEDKAHFRFLRIRACQGKTEYPESRLVDCRRGRASADVARLLGLRAGAAVIVLRRVLSFSGKPAILDQIQLPSGLFKGLNAARILGYGGSMYSLFETQFGIKMVRAEERLKAVPADPGSADLLRVAKGSPLLSVERVAYTYGDKPVEWRRGLCVTDGHYYLNELS